MQHLDRPVVCPVLIGRAPHLDELQRYLALVTEQRGQTLLVGGEAGIGKSRLVAEATTRAAQRGMAILRGHCFESQRSLPYAPLIDLLRAAEPHQLAEALGSGARELVRLLPELTPLVNNAAPEHAEQEKYRLFRAMVDGMRRLAADRAALVIIEDAHWSDDASLDFLADLARQLARLPILLLITYRNDEVSSALGRFLASLDRQRLAAELRLKRLERQEVADMLRATCRLQQPVRAEFLDAVYTLTDGNPFFIEEVLRALVAAGDLDLSSPDEARLQRPIGRLHVPRSVRDAVARRTEQLSAAGRRTLSVAAVAGHRFDFELLEKLMGVDESELVLSIKELLAAGLVIEESADHFAFRHALTREAVRAGLLARERKALHRAIGEAMEQGNHAPSDANAADLAYHFSEAEVWAGALQYAPLAAAQARALYAPGTAVEYLTRAVEAARHLGLEPPSELLRTRGQVYETLGEFEPARADFEATLEHARATGDRYAEWQALIDLGGLWVGRSYERGGEYYFAALDLARQFGEGDALRLARTLNCVGNWHTNLDQPTEALDYHREALDLFRAADDRRGIAETLDLLGMASYLQGDRVAAVAHFGQAVAHLRALDHRQALASALATLAIASGGGRFVDVMLLPATHPENAREAAEAALEIAREIGWRAGETYALNCVATAASATGAYGRALETAHGALRLAEELEHREWLVHADCTLGTLYLDLLALPEARLHHERAVAAAPGTASRYWMRFSAGLAAVTNVEHGNLANATSLLDGLLDLTRPPRTWAERVLWYAYARLVLATGKAESALDVIDRLLASEPNARLEQTVPRLSHVRGEALAALGRAADAEAALRAARSAAAEHAARPVLWRVDLSLGRLLGAHGRRTDAEAAFASARSIVDELVIELPDTPARDRFVQRTAELLPRPRQLTPRQAAKQALSGLTAREWDVAVLIGRGMSNREIADSLVLGERTVQTHVSHILDKLSFSSRAQIAAWAARRASDPS